MRVKEAGKMGQFLAIVAVVVIIITACQYRAAIRLFGTAQRRRRQRRRRGDHNPHVELHPKCAFARPAAVPYARPVAAVFQGRRRGTYTQPGRAQDATASPAPLIRPWRLPPIRRPGPGGNIPASFSSFIVVVAAVVAAVVRRYLYEFPVLTGDDDGRAVRIVFDDVAAQRH